MSPILIFVKKRNIIKSVCYAHICCISGRLIKTKGRKLRLLNLLWEIFCRITVLESRKMLKSLQLGLWINWLNAVFHIQTRYRNMSSSIGIKHLFIRFLDLNQEVKFYVRVAGISQILTQKSARCPSIFLGSKDK